MVQKNTARQIIAGCLINGWIIFTSVHARISEVPLVVAGGSLVYSSPMLDAASLAYRASYTAHDWGGDLQAFRVHPNGSLGALLWRAALEIPDWQVRNIVFWNAQTRRAADFQWSELSAQQKSSLGDIGMLKYLRGSSSSEVGHQDGTLRKRKSRLGDIINSLPLVVKNTDFGYAALAPEHGGGRAYQQFLIDKNRRPPMVYVGANDGMLHAFDALSGVEKFAYIPAAVFPRLRTLSHTDYQHRYFVDGQLTEGDAYLALEMAAFSSWKTLLIGTSGAGAKGVFALNVSTPDLLNAKSIMWERTDDEGDYDIGHILGLAAVVRLRNGQWAALYGNGYHSKNKAAVLYLVNMADGSLIKKISAGTGQQHPANGLSTPALLFNARREVIAAYAGDLRGNLWKFDLESTQPNDWKIAYQGRPFYVARDRHRQRQPIVQQPVITRHPKGGRMILFGTGKLFEVDDPTDFQPQAIYGIWERGETIIDNRDQLQLQTLTSVAGGRTISKNPVDWSHGSGWYIDLPKPGERVIGKLHITNGQLMVLTYTPGDLSSVPTSELMLIDVTTGTAPFKPPFPGLLSEQASINVESSGSSPTLITQPDGKRSVVIQGGDGSEHIVPLNITPKIPFRTWHQLSMPY